MKIIYTLGRFGLTGLLLAFAVALQAQPGGWSVNFSQYQYNMTITAQIQVNGVPNHALNNHLAVFSKGQIRGYATPVAINGQAFYFITAYANAYQGDTLYFRAFIGSTQKIYESTDTLIFRHQNIVGKISAPYQVHLFLGARPLIYSLSEVNYGINACTDVLDVQSSDNINSEGNGLTYSIIGGADASKFTINPVTGVISWFNFTPVFNPPGDANGDNKYELKIKVVDAAGLSDVQNLTVKIVQESPLNPLVCPASFTINTSSDGTGDCSAKTTQAQIYALNPCDLFGITYTLTGATTGTGAGQIPSTLPFQKGVTTATYLRGSGSQCSFTITVVDNEAPVITCPADKTVNTQATPPCAAVVNNIDAVYSDNCTSAFLTYTYAGAATGTGTGQLSGTTFPVGQTQVVYKATDGAGLTATCTFSITVVDAMPPTALCKNATVQLGQNGTVAILASDIDNGSSDNCGIGSLSVSPNSFTCANAGNNTVTLTVTDVNNNVSTCTATVLVKALSLGNLVFKDLNRNGLFDAGDAGVNGVLCNLYADDGDGTLDAGDGAPVATFTTNTLNGQPGSYLFSLLCPGDYIVEIAPSNFNAGGPLYDNTLQAPLVSSPFNGAPDPDNNVNNDDNGEAVSGFGVASQAITLALNLEPVNDGDSDANTNLSLDFGFKTAATVSIGDATLAEGTGGATTAFNFTVTRSDNLDALSLVVNTQNGTAFSASDYAAINNGTVSFAAGGSLTATVTVLVNQDNMVEPDETFTVNLTDPSGNVFFTDASGLGTINNDDSAVLTLSGGTAQNEGAAFTFTATLNNPVQGGFSVPYTTNDGTATTADNDYTDNDGMLTFAGTAGEIKTITVNSTSDNKVELNETFTVALGSITGAPAGVSTAGSPQTGTITNDDAAAVSIAANVSQAEAAGPQAFSVTLTNPVDVPVTVQFSTSNGTATTSDNDYVAIVNQTVTFPAGSTANQTVNVTINNDNKVEADELYNVAIASLSSSGRNVTLGTSSRTGTILNDDASVVTLSGGIAQNEGNTGTTSYVFTATLSNPVQGGFTVNYTTNDGTATTAGNDYVDNDGALSFTGTAGEAKTITVNVNGDLTVELDETFTVALGSITGAPAGVSTAGSPQTGTITNDDAAAVSIAANVSQAEAAGPQAFSVTLTNPVDVPVTVQFSTSNGTATTADNDYVAIVNQTVTFPAGTTTAQTVNVTINNDNKVEADELYNVAIANLSASGRNVTLGTTSRTGTILNDDASVVTLSGGIAQNEGNTGTTSYVFTATLSNPVQGGFTVNYTTNDGTATTAGNDYTDNDGALSFAGTAGEAKTITVNVNGDLTVELDETFTVALGSITGAPAGVSTAGSPQTGTITNDDAAAVSIAANVSQAEAAGPQAFSVTLTNPVDVPVTVQFSTSNGTATTADNDYVAIVNQTVTLPAGSTANQTVNVTINNDNKVESDEVYNVAIASLSASGRNVTLGTTSRTGTILNDDASVVTLSGGIAQNEGNTGTTSYVFTATLSNPVQGGFTVNYTTNDGTATTAGNDYTDNDGALSFTGTAGEAKTITVNVNGDLTVELDETFTVALGSITGAPAGVSTAGSPQTGTITNDDAAAVSIAANVSQAEAAGPQAFSVTLTNPVDVPVTVQFSTSNGTATTADNDYVAIVNQTVTFPAGSTANQTVNVTINNDNKVESDELYNVAIANLSASGRNVTLGTSSRTGTILNDDASVVTLSGGIAQNEGNTGTTSYVFTATLSNPVQGGFTVNYTTNDGTATTAGNDYTDNDGALAFAGTAGEAKTITVNVNGDLTVELDETFTVALGSITGAPAGVSTAGSPQTGTITNDDAATVALAANISQIEAGSLQTFIVTITNPVDVPVTVQFSTSNGTATTADNDYVGIVNQTVTFPAGTTTAQTVNVTINNDNKVEADEVYNVAIANLSASGRNVTLGTSSRTGTILNDDASVVTLSGGIAQNEGNTGTTSYVFTATLSNPVQGGFTANYTTNDGTATTAGNDYVDNDGALSFAGTAGETKTFTVLVNGDLNIEANETFQTAINSLTGIPTPPAVTIAGSPQTATITNDELDWGDAPTAAQSGFAGSYPSTLSNNGARHGAAPGGLRLGASLDADLDGQPDATASGDGADEDGVTLPAVLVTGNNANVTVVASAAGILNAWVDFNRDGDWADAGEQVFSNQSVAAGSNSLSFAVPAVVSVGTSFARFRLATAPGVSFSGLAADGEVEDYVVSLVNTQFTINDPVVTEGNAGTSNLSFVISRSVNSGACSVNYAITGGTATTADNDYQTLAAGTASFTAGGALSQTINVLVNGDLKVELNETVDMTLSNPVNGSILDGAGTGTITNDDAATVTITNPVVTEGDVSTTVNLSYTIALSNPSDANVEMNYTTVDGTATVADNDYASAGGNLIFSPGQLSKTVTITANGDCKIEADETFLLRLSALVNNGRNVNFNGGGATLDGTGTISNDDALPVITCPGNISKNVDAGTCTTSVLLPLPTTSSICGTSTLEFRYRTVDAQNTPTGPFTAFAPSSNNTVIFSSGRYEVEWRVTDGSGSSSCSLFLTVVDNQPPTIACPANQIVNANASCSGLVGAWTPVSLSDNCTPTGQIVVTQTPAPSTILTGHGSFATVTLTARDLSNNTASCTFSVTLRDVTPPVAKCKIATANLGANGLVTVLPTSVDNGSSDNCTFTLTLTPNTFSCSNIGQNTVTLRATDAGGNTATCTTKVTVVDNTPPTAKCKNATIFLNSVGQATLTPADVNNGSSDNCSIGTLTISKSLFNCSEISGTNPVTLTLTDVNGNSSSCIAYVTVKDNLAPTAVCNNVTVKLNQAGNVTVYPATLASNSFDNCSVFSYSPTVKIYTTANIGVNNLTITVKDFSGNASTCVSVVTVQPYNFVNNDDRSGDDQQTATEQVHLAVFPNPTTGDVTLQFDLPADQEYSAMIFDLSGRLVYSRKDAGKQGENTLPIQLNGVASGIYLLDFQTDAFKSHVRLVVQE